MPKMPIRKAKRVGVLTKRTQCLRRHYKEQSYRPLYEKIKNNNCYLAKALSEEKQNNQSLFTQNIQLIGEKQQLNLICDTQNTVISNVLTNAKEVLKMLVTMTGYMTNTISMCQELVASNATVRLSSTTLAGNKESTNRFSTKSPAKGVVKPMVGGHTITKPTINLSRVNMENINISRLSDIQEVATPNRSQEINDTRSPITVPLATTPLRYENGRPCRLPERIRISSPRVNENEQRLRRKRSHHSKRLSVSFSRSRNRWSDETPTTAGHITIIGSQINVDNQENNDAPQDLSTRNITVPESQSTNSNEEEDETHANTSKKDSDIQINNKISNKDFNRNLNLTENSRLSRNNTRVWEEEDPLEGPSWLFNNTIPSRDNEPEELDHVNVSDANNNTSRIIMYDGSNVTDNNIEEISHLNESINNTPTSGRGVADDTEYKSYLHEDMDSNFCEILPTESIYNHERNLDNAEDNVMKFTNFVTMRQEHSEALEDFTLLLRQPAQNTQFNIDELRLPVLEDSAINDSSRIKNEIDSEVTVTIPRVTNIPVASVSNRNLNQSEYDHITIKLPLIVINDHKRMSTSLEKNHSKNKKSKTSNMEEQMKNSKDSVTVNNKVKKRNKSKNSRDPSTAKVVLEKLNESHVKPKILTPNDTQNANNLEKESTFEEKSPQSMESNVCANRPKRRKAPVNLTEPKLNVKLRRNK
ncbi:LOW QUALITY PROTEIN: uncharacterized protein DDB_G0288805-like [Pogonomyrmex barbatus]|uniref:LOW QUALITY PROTEIN: uncharacterized protein DDB_G0288805-like n=1 Tax=Pogonomyrmex barbatus TaxID=144034 RepID=A0A6I9WCB4_9HYME|nr:LOW QUALITY PROTEIN: uncharacterized protein DDB_G0288805-like [Pogonomyrmex barbatus]